MSQERIEELQELVGKLQARIVELERWPDTGQMMDNTSAEHLLAGWRNRCLAAEHKNAKLLVELEEIRRKYMELHETANA